MSRRRPLAHEGAGQLRGAGVAGRAPDWFAALGKPLTAAQRRDIAAIVAASPLPAGDVVVLADWSAVAATLPAIERDDAWWAYEEDEREALWSLACRRRVEDDVAARLAAARHAGTMALDAALQRALPAADATFQRAIAGMAALAAHQHALATLAGVAAAHPFHRKYRLFAAGRLPLGYHAGRYFIY